ncbi:MAG: flagellar basal body P-ring formation protein FlgA, partial [Anaerolineaceae bacterium]|nr:flagellar basal body P-ring formation protein FlgA [Anaerolineaceae bacterium]
TVAGAAIRLGDIALVEGPLSEGLRSLVICPSPLAGRSLSLDRRRIRRRLLANLPLADFRLSGAEACTVIRAAEGRSSTASGRKAPGEKNRPVQSLRALLERVIGKGVDLPPQEYRVEFDSRNAADLALADDVRTFKVSGGSGDKVVGQGTFRVEISSRNSPGEIVRTLYVRYHVVFLAQIVVATRDVRPGEVLSRDDVRLERREFRSDKVRWLRKVDDVVGTTARGAMGVGQMIRREDVARTFYVRRGEPVTIHIIGRGFSMKTRSRALESGELGSTIAVQGKDGKARFYARVIDIRTVEVRLSGAPESSPPPKTAPQPGDARTEQSGKEDT